MLERKQVSMLATSLAFSHQLLEEVIQKGDHVVDATMGNGHDTVFLAGLVGEAGKVYAFDIQNQALQTTQAKLLQKALIDRVTLISDGHENIKNYLGKNEVIQAAIFNLGYLPRSDKTIITKPSTTLQALRVLCSHLGKKGRILIVAYYGHDGGLEELHQVENFCQKLPQDEFQTLTYRFLNQKNQPPILFCIERKG